LEAAGRRSLGPQGHPSTTTTAAQKKYRIEIDEERRLRGLTGNFPPSAVNEDPPRKKKVKSKIKRILYAPGRIFAGAYY